MDLSWCLIYFTDQHHTQSSHSTLVAARTVSTRYSNLICCADSAYSQACSWKRFTWPATSSLLISLYASHKAIPTSPHRSQSSFYSPNAQKSSRWLDSTIIWTSLWPKSGQKACRHRSQKTLWSPWLSLMKSPTNWSTKTSPKFFWATAIVLLICT